MALKEVRTCDSCAHTEEHGASVYAGRQDQPGWYRVLFWTEDGPCPEEQVHICGKCARKALRELSCAMWVSRKEL
jgi:hypothetical protein